uniref:Coiled-coil domain containing 170 n=1 Tax=Terrapene triunguis TaxID=2587831 RepID=A0A674JKC3_9SAUR
TPQCVAPYGVHCSPLQSQLETKEASLQEMKSEVEIYKENNARQSSKIQTLKAQVKELEEIATSVTSVKSQSGAYIYTLKRKNQELSERVSEFEKHLRMLLVRREKAEQKVASLEKKLAEVTDKLSSSMNIDIKGQEDPLGFLVIKVRKTFERNNTILLERLKDKQIAWDNCCQELLHKEKKFTELDRALHASMYETKTTQTLYQTFISQLATLLSNTFITVAGTEEAIKERIQEICGSEHSWKSKTDELQQKVLSLTSQLEQQRDLYHEALSKSYKAEEVLQKQKGSLKRVEKKLAAEDLLLERFISERKKSLKAQKESEKLQEQLSEMKMSNQTLQLFKKTIFLQNKTIEELSKSLEKVEKIKEKAARKVVSLKTELDYTEHEARKEKERAHHMLEAVTNELHIAKRALEEVARREKQLVDFREAITKIMGFRINTLAISDKEIIRQLKQLIQAYEISKVTSNNESKLSCGFTTRFENQ